jgi:hypothetical protein
LEGWVEVFPGWIETLDEFGFLVAGGLLEVLLAGDRASDVAEVFEVDEAMDCLSGGVGSWVLVLVGFCSAGQMVRHADVEVAGTAGEDVDPEVEFAGHGVEGSRGGMAMP